MTLPFPALGANHIYLLRVLIFFIAAFTSVVISQSNYFAFGFAILSKKPLEMEPCHDVFTDGMVVSLKHLIQKVQIYKPSKGHTMNFVSMQIISVFVFLQQSTLGPSPRRLPKIRQTGD